MYDNMGCMEDSRLGSSRAAYLADMELMRERFAKLLLGEDMSGGGKGVSSALALSNAITNLAGSVFSEWQLDQIPPEKKARWKKEMDWLLCVTDNIVEMVPKQQKSKDGTQMEIMTTQQRADLQENLPALRKLDNMLLEYLDNFRDQNEFWYVARDASDLEKGNSAQRSDDKWWHPAVKVPPEGLPYHTRKWLQFQKDNVTTVLRAASAINVHVLSKMDIPEAYIETLPKKGRASLGDAVYKSITLDIFDAQQLLSTLDLSTDQKILDLKNRIEASSVIWKRKMHNKDGKSSWAGVSVEKREIFEERAENILSIIRQKYPGISQSLLDTSKIKHNQDIGKSVLESYSRVLETAAYTVISLIEDVLHAHDLTQDATLANSKRRPLSDTTDPIKLSNHEEEIHKLSTMEPPISMTLAEFMECQMFLENKKSNYQDPDALGIKPLRISTKKLSYIEKLENSRVLRSPSGKY